jgi:PAS domain S-box-containing protein
MLHHAEFSVQLSGAEMAAGLPYHMLISPQMLLLCAGHGLRELDPKFAEPTDFQNLANRPGSQEPITYQQILDCRPGLVTLSLMCDPTQTVVCDICLTASGDILLLAQLSPPAQAALEPEIKSDAPTNIDVTLWQLLDHIDQGILVYDHKLTVLGFNTTALDMLEMPHNKFHVGGSFEDWVQFTAERSGYGGAGSVGERVAKRLEIARSFKPYVADNKRPDGRTIEIRGRPLPGGGFVTTYTDVSERKNSEQAVRDSEQRLLQILDSSPLGVNIVGPDGRRRFSNKSIVEMTGWHEEELNHSNVKDSYADPSLREVLVHDLEQHGFVNNHEVEFIRKDGSHYWALLSLRKIDFKGENSVLGWLYNISERVEMELALKDNRQQLERHVEDLRDREERLEIQARNLVDLVDEVALARNDLAKLNEQKNTFFSIIAHDLKGPLNALLGFSQLLALHIERDDQAALKRAVQAIGEAGDQFHRLLENLLEWSSLQMGQLNIEPQTIDVTEKNSETLNTLGPVAAAKNVTLVAENQDVQLAYGDPDITKTIIRNLTNNAIKFTPAKGCVSVSALQKDALVEVRVADTGVGMSDTQLANIFRLDVRTSTQGTNGETGSGLGLQLCKELVERQGGNISVTSSPGKGSNFTFTLPARALERWQTTADSRTFPSSGRDR